MSLGWAERHREQLAGVVLMNTAVSSVAGTQPPGLIRLARATPVLATATVRTSLFVNGAIALSRRRIAPDVRRGFRAPYLTPGRRTAIADFVADIPFEADHPSAAVLDAVATGLAALDDLPVLLLWGSADRVFSDVYLHDLERRLPHADVHRYADAGHFMSEDVDAVGAIVDWLGTLERRVTPVSAPHIASTHGRHPRRARRAGRDPRAGRRRPDDDHLRGVRRAGGRHRRRGWCRRACAPAIASR